MEITVTLAKVLVTQENLERLQGFLDSGKSCRDRDRTHLEVLSQKLDSFEVVPTDEIPRDVVTMNSQVAITDLDAGRLSIYTLVFPGAAIYRRERYQCLPLSEPPFSDPAPVL